MGDLFSETWVLVTGASSGLGEVFARQLAARKANLILTARSGDTLRALAASVEQAHGIQTAVIAQDLGATGGAAALCAAADLLGHPIEHLISNAGFGAFGTVATSDPARLADMVRLNCEALVVLTAHFLPGMVDRKRGGVIHVASVGSFQPVPYQATYGATKAFVLSFSEAVAEEVRDAGVRVLALCPGPVQTGFQAAAGADISPQQARMVLSAEEVVSTALHAYEAGKDTVVPGAYNAIGAWGVRLLPRRTVARIAGNMIRGKVRR